MEILKKIGGFLLEIIQVIVFSVAIFLFLYLLVVQPHKIKGDSMQPNYPNGEYLLTEKISYRTSDPQRGDVIVFEAPGGKGDEYIKRIIGLPGEKVTISNGKVVINGKELTEDYLADNLFTSAGIFAGQNEEITVPANSYYVLGDNRPYSSDSRTWGFVERKKISGRAWFVYWPLSQKGLVKKIDY